MILHHIELHIAHELPHLFRTLISRDGQHAWNESATSKTSAFIEKLERISRTNKQKNETKRIQLQFSNLNDILINGTVFVPLTQNFYVIFAKSLKPNFSQLTTKCNPILPHIPPLQLYS